MSLKPSEKILIACLCIVTFYPAWFMSSKSLAIVDPVIPLSLVLLFVTLLAPWLGSETLWQPLVKARVVQLIRDPVFWLGIFLSLFLFIQWWNSGAIRAFDNGKVRLIPLAFKDLPFTVNGDEGWVQLNRFLLFWVVVLAVRVGVAGRGAVQTLLSWSLVNTSALALVGLAQFLSGTDKILWHYPTGVHFFATIGYENHAGAYFVLGLALACGLFIDAYRQGKGLVGLFLLITLHSTAVVMTYSRSAYLFLAMIWVLLLAVLAVIYLRKALTSRRLIMVIAVPLTLFVLLCAALYSGGGRVRQEIISMRDVPTFAKTEFAFRSWQWGAAFNIWRDYPLFGIGADGGRYIQRFYLAKDRRFITRNAGKANVHSDYFQYLAEMGLVGGLFLCGLVFFTLTPLRRFCRLQPGDSLILAGTFCTCLHAGFDLPFRSTAIACLWGLLFTSIGRGEDKNLSHKPFGILCRLGVITLSLIPLVVIVWLVSFPLNHRLGPQGDHLYSENQDYQRSGAGIHETLTYALALEQGGFLEETLMTLQASYQQHPESDDLRGALYDLCKRQGWHELSERYKK